MRFSEFSVEFQEMHVFSVEFPLAVADNIL